MLHQKGTATVAQAADKLTSAPAGEEFREGYVEADGFRIRYMAAGEGPALIHLHGAGGLRLTPGHDLLSRHFRVVAFEMPGFGDSAENTRTPDMPELAATMAKAADELGLGEFNLMGTSFGGKTALWLAVQQPQRVRALVLEAPAAIRPKGAQPPSGSPEEMARRLYAHPEQVAPLPAARPGGAGKGRAWSRGCAGPTAMPILSAAARTRHPDAGPVRHGRPGDPAGDGAFLQGADAQLPLGLCL